MKILMKRIRKKTEETHLPYAIMAYCLTSTLAYAVPFSLVPKVSKPVSLSLVHPTHLHGLIPRLL